MLSKTCKNKLEWICSSQSELYLENKESIPKESKQLSFIGSGWFGKAYTLKEFPNLVVKFCAQEIDAFPFYIRYLEKLKNRPEWAPEVFLHGGSELDGVFWCVMPRYETIRSGTKYGDKSEVLERFKADWYNFEKKLLSIKIGQIDHGDTEAREMRKFFMDLCKMSGTLDDKGNPYLDTHPGNILWNSKNKSFIYLDPLRYISVDIKKNLAR